MVKIEKETAFNLIYDFLKKNRIVREFVIEAFKYNKARGRMKTIPTPFGRDNTKGIILSLIEQYSNLNRNSLADMFMSFDGSFEWAASTQGSSYWSGYLQYKWHEYLFNRYKDHLILII